MVTAVLFSLVVALMFNDFEKSWKFVLRIFIDTACVFLAQLFIADFNFWFFNTVGVADSVLPYSKYYLWLIVCFLHVLYPRKPTRLSLRLTIASFTSIFLIMDLLLSGSFGFLVLVASGASLGSVYNDLTSYLLIAVVVSVMLLLKTLSVRKYKYVKKSSLLILNGILLVSYIIPIVSEILLDPKETQLYQGLLSTFLLILDTLAYVLFFLTIASYNQVIDSQAVALKAESEKNQLEVSNSKYEEMHRIRHDIKNQFEYLNQLVKEKEYGKLETYLSDLSEKVHFAVDYFDCGNEALNRILNLEKSKAESKGVSLTVKAVVPSKLAIEESDLVSLVANLLDNAIEETSQCQQKEKSVQGEFTYQGNYLVIVIRNPLAEGNTKEKALRLKSTKKERFNHGYGTKIIRAVSQKYQGLATFDVVDDCFVAKVMLALPQASLQPKEESICRP
ncbi:MAG: GHKL domain-containing protein [Bacilli bacterium]|nr:GHKL domain-containing protein [Bacilli bacterium]